MCWIGRLEPSCVTGVTQEAQGGVKLGECPNPIRWIPQVLWWGRKNWTPFDSLGDTLQGSPLPQDLTHAWLNPPSISDEQTRTHL